jgi:DNA-directed RNA polymerase specialized sigma24 family protein
MRPTSWPPGPVVTSVSPACPTRSVMLRMDKDQDKLLADALRGDQIALQQLLLHNYTRLADSIRTRVPASLRTVVDVDDVLQSTFIQVFRGLSGFRDGDAEAFFAWMRSIAAARLKDAIRSATRKKRGGDWSCEFDRILVGPDRFTFRPATLPKRICSGP